VRTVSEVSELANVTVRTLHHYDEIGLLSPAARSDAGYRLYSRADLERLQEVLVWRQLGFSLTEIRRLLDDPGHDRLGAVRQQLELIGRKIERLGATARALEAALAAHENESDAQEATMFEGFESTDYELEARERWGDSAAHSESAARTAGYGEREWREIAAESGQINADFAASMAAGEPAGGERAQAIAKRHREHISRWFYPCSPELHCGLGELYVADARFAANFESHHAGLAAYVRDAIAAGASASGPPHAD
jgi:DNA-binding transcriptional MerR regulator